MSPDVIWGPLFVWGVIGGGCGAAMIDRHPSEGGPWHDANWAQKGALLFAFGPLMWVLVPGIWIMNRTLVPAAAMVWRWLGTL